MKGSIKVGIVQARPGTSIDETMADALDLTRDAAGDEADLVVLPESWVLVKAYSEVEQLCDAAEGILDAFGRVAVEFGVHVVPGALYERIEGRPVITSPVLGLDGDVLGRQLKVHLFRDRERELFSAGATYEVFDLGICRLGLMVCYDVVFPEVSRILALRGADLILNPSRILSPGISPWHLYLKARCLENRMPLVGVNVSRSPLHDGGSLALEPAIDPDFEIVHPRVVGELGKNPRSASVELDLGPSSLLRRKRLAARTPETYVGLSEPGEV
ncbi:MAG: carbon-nitrogen hydrolase family protein [Candidatus Geothermarchaeales archaeon]